MTSSTAEETLNSTSTASQTPPAAVRSVALSRRLIITSLILATALSALDGTVVATAMPTIVGVLGGLPLYSLVVSAFLLTATTTVPLFGKLSDIYGRKPVFMFGSGMFIAGSALCGLAWDMPSLIAFRAIQGLGAGAIVPVSLTVIGDVFEVEERARLQGVFSAVWGVSSVIGPLVGGAIVQFFDWRWVFFVNVPVGIFSALLLFLNLREPPIHERQKVDVAGAVVLTFGVGAVLVALQSTGHGDPFSLPNLATWAVALVLLVLFGFIERRAPSPILSLQLLSRPIIAIPSLVGLLASGVLIGFAAYVPLLVQGAWGSTPVEAGLILAPLSIGWPIASSSIGRLLRRFSYRRLALMGMAIIVVGSALLLAVQIPVISESLLLRVSAMALAGFVAGYGMGMSATSMLIAVQISVPWSERGIATASVQFFRNMGQAVTAAVLGAVLTASLSAALSSPGTQAVIKEMPHSVLKAGSDPALGPVNALFDLSIRDTLAHTVRAALSSALAGGLTWVYVVMLAIAAVGAVVAIKFPRVVQQA